MNYRKKPVVIEAFQLGIDNIPDWFMDRVSEGTIILHGDALEKTNADIETLEGWHHASYGDYIIRGVKGEIYPCKPDIFIMTYDNADKGSDPEWMGFVDKQIDIAMIEKDRYVSVFFGPYGATIEVIPITEDEKR